jgi:uncharacterized protein
MRSIVKSLAAIASALAIAALPAASYAQNAVRFGTSSVGSTFYTLVVGAGEVITKHSKINVTVEALGGSSANVFGLGAEKIEFALANSYAAYTGYNGTAPFKKPVDVRLMLQSDSSNRYLVVTKRSGIKTPKDLEGKTFVAQRRALPELEIVMDAYVKYFNLDKSKIRYVATTTTNEVLDVLRTGSVHGAIMPFSEGAAHIEEPMRDGVIDFFYITREQRDGILKLLPGVFYPNVIEKKDGFTNQQRDAYMVALNTYVLTRPGVPEETVYRVAKAIFENPKELASYHANAGLWTAERALQNPGLPYHPGVIRYFREKGLWTPVLEAKQNELLKR